MTKASDNAFPSILITEGTEPSAPAAGKQRLYIDSTTHHLTRTNSSGTETDIEASAGGISASIVDAAGDLIVGSAADTVVRKAAGSDWTKLQARAGATNGIEWTGFIGAKAYRNAAVQATGGTDVALTLDTEEFDTHAFHDTSSNTSRMTIPSGMGGKYLCVAGSFSSGSGAIYLRVNGTTKVRSARSTVGTGVYHNISAIVSLSAADYVEVIATSNTNYGAAADLNGETSLAIEYLGP